MTHPMYDMKNRRPTLDSEEKQRVALGGVLLGGGTFISMLGAIQANFPELIDQGNVADGLAQLVIGAAACAAGFYQVCIAVTNSGNSNEQSSLN